LKDPSESGKSGEVWIFSDVVSLRIYVVNYKPEDAVPVGEAIREFFPKDAPPASTLLGVTSLAVKDFLIEIEAIAVVE
jgi:enamine deaminase RidA (YjgF/YER057c/UK114 family)